MVAMSRRSLAEVATSIDQHVVLHGVRWADYEAVLAMRGEKAVPRITYLEGELELMMPSRNHEMLASWIGRLIETYAEVLDIDISPYGSWTLKNERRERGVEPDECYIFGRDQSKDVPDLAIEVIWTHGGLDKLEVYRRLGVGELWIWRDERIEVYLLRDERYEIAPRSALLPAIDLDLLLSFVEHPSLTAAKRAYREALERLVGSSGADG